MTTPSLDILGIGNAIVDVLARAEDAFLGEHGMAKGGMANKGNINEHKRMAMGKPIGKMGGGMMSKGYAAGGMAKGMMSGGMMSKGYAAGGAAKKMAKRAK